MFTRIAAVTAATLLLLAPSAPAAGAAPRGTPSGRGTGDLSVTALRVSVAEALDLQVGLTTGTATLDAERLGLIENLAAGEVTAVIADGASLPTMRFPDPPLSATSSDGRREHRRGSADIAVPGQASNVAGVDVVGLVGSLVPGAVDAVDGAISPGSLAGGSFEPAHIVSEVAHGAASVSSTTELGSVRILGGLSSFAGAGPGEHRAWASGDESGARAQTLRIESATLLDTGAALGLLGVDVADLPRDAVADLAAVLGVPVDAGAVIHAPLLAVADVAVTAHAVAAVDPDGAVHTATSTGGGVGAVVVAGVEAGGFALHDTLDQWDGLEVEVNRLLANVLGQLGPEYRDAVRVRVVPRLVEETQVEGPYALAAADLALLEVRVDLPAVEGAPGAGAPPTAADGFLDELPADVPGTGGGAPETGGLLGSPIGGATTIVLGEMTVKAEHTRPGVSPEPPGCDPACMDVVNLSWTPEDGFGAPVGPVPVSDDLPRTGGTSLLAPGSAFVAAAFLARRLVRPLFPVTPEESL